jgi:hypothetical protein
LFKPHYYTYGGANLRWHSHHSQAASHHFLAVRVATTLPQSHAPLGEVNWIYGNGVIDPVPHYFPWATKALVFQWATELVCPCQMVSVTAYDSSMSPLVTYSAPTGRYGAYVAKTPSTTTLTKYSWATSNPPTYASINRNPWAPPANPVIVMRSLRLWTK